TFDTEGTVADGTAPEDVAARLRDTGADVIGVNCGDGPQLSLAMAQRMRRPGLPIWVQPNAGLPRHVDGRLLYMATPEYFDVYARRMFQAGAHIVGGCCGTTPEHVRWMAKSARMMRHGEVTVESGRTPEIQGVSHGEEPMPLAE